MTQQVTVTHSVLGVASGNTVVPAIDAVTTYVVDGIYPSYFRMETAGEKFFAVAGTSVVGEVDASVLDIATIRGFQLTSDEVVTVNVNALGAVPAKSMISDGVAITTLKIENDSGLSANIKLVLWGLKS